MKELGRQRIKAWLALLGVALWGCSDDDEAATGELTVLLEAEETITGGIPAAGAGEDEEAIQDGWEVRFDRYLLAIGEIDLHLGSDESVEAHAEEAYVVDLSSVPESGMQLWSLQGLRAGRWEFGYSTPGAAHGALRHDSVSEADFQQMVDGDWTYLIAGSMTNAGGRSCPPERLAMLPATATSIGNNEGGDACYPNPQIDFSFGVNAETFYALCELDGVSGVSIPSGGVATVTATIHGDHLFFNGFPEGDEGGILRLAQWLADSDLDLDGTVTEQELTALRLADLPEFDSRYELGGFEVNENMWEYLRAQLKTQGHMDGEGECAPDAVAHED